LQPKQPDRTILTSTDEHQSGSTQRAPVVTSGGSLQVSSTGIEGAVLIDPLRRSDDRGYFARAWCSREFAAHGIKFDPVQANTGFNKLKGTLRGMHLQVTPALEAKLVNCTRGSIFDVVLDVRLQSPTYLQWYGVELSSENRRLLYIPEGCAHGYQTLEDLTDVYYLASQYYTPSAARGLRFDDPAFGIKWPLTPTLISDQDRSWPMLNETSL
jgi:dTDP-4-dehydrorhamnose 3,5-epimerase